MEATWRFRNGVKQSVPRMKAVVFLGIGAFLGAGLLFQKNCSLVGVWEKVGSVRGGRELPLPLLQLLWEWGLAIYVGVQFLDTVVERQKALRGAFKLPTLLSNADWIVPAWSNRMPRLAPWYVLRVFFSWLAARTPSPHDMGFLLTLVRIL